MDSSYLVGCFRTYLCGVDREDPKPLNIYPCYPLHTQDSDGWPKNQEDCFQMGRQLLGKEPSRRHEPCINHEIGGTDAIRESL